MKKRCILGVQLFVGHTIHGIIKSSISFILLAMVGTTNVDKELSTESDEFPPTFLYVIGIERRHKMGNLLQVLLIVASYWGTIPTTFLGGWLADIYSPCKLITLSTIFTGLFHFAIPLGASIHFILPIIIQFFIELLGGLLQPASYKLISLWTPKDEQGLMMTTFLGGQCGLFFCWIIMRIILPTLGWQYVCLFIGVITILWAMTFFWLIVDIPNAHSTISQEEKNYLAKKVPPTRMISQNKNICKCFPPVVAIIQNGPFIAYFLLHLGDTWTFRFFVSLSPRFLFRGYNWNTFISGFYITLPFLLRILFGIIFGKIGDHFVYKHTMTLTTIRKFFTLFSHTIPGFLMLFITFQIQHTMTYMLIYYGGIILNSATVLTVSMNNLDLSPNYAGSLYGIAKTLGYIIGTVLSFVVVCIMDMSERSIHQKWNISFTVCAFWYIFTSIIFCKYSSGEVQPFNEL